MSLVWPPLVRFDVCFFAFLCLSEGLSSSVFAVFFLKWVVLDYIAYGSVIRVSKVPYDIRWPCLIYLFFSFHPPFQICFRSGSTDTCTSAEKPAPGPSLR